MQQSFYHSLDTPSVVIDVRRPMGVPAARLGHAYDTRASAWAWASAQAHWGSYGFGTTMEQLWNNYGTTMEQLLNNLVTNYFF